MESALMQALKARDSNETPVGAVVVLDDRIIASAYNLVETLKNPLAHAELSALQDASASVGQKYLHGTTLYTTLEPCILCASAAVLYRIDRIVYGASDLRWGGCGTIFNITGDNRLNHRIEIIGGIMEAECSEIIKEFYVRKRG